MKLRALAALNNDELGDFIGKVDLEQTRVFKGARDMDELLMIESGGYTPYNNFDLWGEETENYYPDFDESCVGMIFINDSMTEELRRNCILEFNFGDIEKNLIYDTSGQGNTGILIGDYSITKNTRASEVIRDSSLELPETDNQDRAI